MSLGLSITIKPRDLAKIAKQEEQRLEMRPHVDRPAAQRDTFSRLVAHLEPMNPILLSLHMPVFDGGGQLLAAVHQPGQLGAVVLTIGLIAHFPQTVP